MLANIFYSLLRMISKFNLIAAILFAFYFASQLVVAKRSWILVSKNNGADGASCMVYQSKHHRLILYHGNERMWAYDISKAQWSTIFHNIWAHNTPIYPNSTGEETSTARPPGLRDHSCTLDLNDTRMWFFGGFFSGTSGVIYLNQLWSFNLETYRWAFWYGNQISTVNTDYSAGVLGYRLKATIAMFNPDILTIINGFKESNDAVYDAWQFNTTSKQMSLAATFPTSKTSFNTYGYFGPPFVTSDVNLPLADKSTTAYAHATNGSIYQFFNSWSPYIARLDASGPTAWQYTPLRGTEQYPQTQYVGGSSYGVYSPLNLPRYRFGQTVLANPNFDYFGVYGGAWLSQNIHDFWVFNTTLAQWTLLWAVPSAPQNYGDKGALDRNGVFWTFGGSRDKIFWSELWAFAETDCNHGWYFNLTDYVCKPYCAANATFTNVTQPLCSCNPGFFGDGIKLCSPCPMGTFKSTAGNGTQTSVCLPCPVNTFTNQTGSTFCSACPEFRTTSSTGQSGCICAAGFFGNESSCSACPVGTFKSTAGNGAQSLCLSCTVNTFANTTSSASCLACPTSSTTLSKTGQSNCFCDAGFFGDGMNFCSACPAGRYKNSSGNGAQGSTCLPCPANTFGNGTAQESCTRCPESSATFSQTAQLSCTCNAGYFGDGLTYCTECPSGTYKNSTGNGSRDLVCLPCVPNTYANTRSGQSNCSCDLGYFGDATTACLPCPAGTHKNYSGNGAREVLCLPCPVNTFSNSTGQRFCSQCPVSSTTMSKSGQLNCTCDAGFYGDGLPSCIACPVGTYKNSSGNGAREVVCLLCAANTFANSTGQKFCWQCPTSSTTLSRSGQLNCTCDAGFYGDGINTCSPCPEGTCKNSPGNGAQYDVCTPCDDGTTATISTNGPTSSSEPLAKPSSNARKTLIVAIAAVTGGLLVFGLVAFAVLKRKRDARKKHATPRDKEQSPLSDASNESNALMQYLLSSGVARQPFLIPHQNFNPLLGPTLTRLPTYTISPRTGIPTLSSLTTTSGLFGPQSPTMAKSLATTTLMDKETMLFGSHTGTDFGARPTYSIIPRSQTLAASNTMQFTARSTIERTQEIATSAINTALLNPILVDDEPTRTSQVSEANRGGSAQE